MKKPQTPPSAREVVYTLILDPRESTTEGGSSKPAGAPPDPRRDEVTEPPGRSRGGTQ